MSKVYQSYKAKKGVPEPSAEWWLKLPDGTQFGPVDLSVLCDWAAQGRVVVGNMVSPDNEKWVPAESVPQLSMTWVTELRNGHKYGPFNMAAVPMLVQRGRLARTATLQHITTGETLSVSAILKAGSPGGRKTPRTAKQAEAKSPGVADETDSSREQSIPGADVPANAAAESTPEQQPAAEPGADQESEGPVKTQAPEQHEARTSSTESSQREQDLARRVSELSEEATARRKRDDLLFASMERLEERVMAVSQRLRQAREQIAAQAAAGTEQAPAQAGQEQPPERIQRLVAHLEKLADQARQRAGESQNHLLQELELQKRRLADMEKVLGERENQLTLQAAGFESDAAEKARLANELKAKLDNERSLRAEAEGAAIRVEQERAEQARLRHEDEAKASARLSELEMALVREQSLRTAAERKVLEHQLELTGQQKRQHDNEERLTEQLSRLNEDLARERSAAAGERDEDEERIRSLTRLIGQFEKELKESRATVAKLTAAIVDADRRRLETATALSEREKEVEDTKAALAKALQDRASAMQTILASPADPETGWCMKGEDETVYGPVSLSELWAWTCQCRVGPLHKISRDKQTWIQAPDLPELRMEWTCTLPDGSTLGPFNPFAFRDMVSDGLVSTDFEVKNRLTGETLTVGKLLTATGEGLTLQPRTTGTDAGEWKQRLAEAEARSQRIAGELAKVESLLRAEQAGRQRLELELAEMRGAPPVPPLRSPQAAAAATTLPPRRVQARFVLPNQPTPANQGAGGNR